MAHRYVIVGSGPAAIAAVESIRRLDRDGAIVMVTDDAHGYYSRPGLAYFLTRQVPRGHLFPVTERDFARLDVERVNGTAIDLDAGPHTLGLEDGRTLPYDRLLLATGSQATPLGLPGEDLDGVVKLDDLADADDIVSRSRGAKAAVVLGGGSTAIEILEGLRAHGVRVHYFMRKPRFWSEVLSEPESRIVEEALRRGGTEVRPSTQASEVLGAGGRVQAVRTTEGDTVRCDIVAAAIGVRPRKSLGESAGLACDRGVLVDAFMRTSSEDVFAAGDIAETLDEGTNRRTIEVLWTSAVAEGRVAGWNMADGEPRPYVRGTSLNLTRLAGINVAIIGSVGGGRRDGELMRAESESWSRDEAMRTVEWEDRTRRLRLALGDDRIAGAVVMGDQAASFPLQDLVGSRAPLGHLAEALASPGADVPSLVQALHEERSATSVQA